MKRMKKLLAIVLVGVMTLAMGSMAFGATASTDTGSITVNGLTGGVTVSAYQIAQATYDNDGNFLGYEMTVSGTSWSINSDGSYTDPTEEDLAELFSQLGSVSASGTATTDFNGTTATISNLPVGSYLIVVTGSESVTYALMIGSVSYTVSGSDWTVSNGTIDVSGSNLWAKATSVVPDKQEVNDSGGEVTGDSHNVGDEIEYHITVSPVPAYYGDYPKFQVTDSMTGLEISQAQLNAMTITATTANGTTRTLVLGTDYTVTRNSDGSGFVVNFVVSDKYTLNDYAGGSVLISYKATITEAALTGDYSDHSNSAVVDYTTDSYVEGEDGESATPGGPTHEYTFSASATKVDNNNSALAGATFALYTDSGCTTAYTQNGTAVTATSGSDGTFTFSGLETGTYYVKETSAPAGYVISDATYTLEISATYNADGTLQTHSIVFKNGSTTITQIVNTQVNGQLPSTGGRGTLIFTLIGCAVVLGAVVGVVATRKRRAA